MKLMTSVLGVMSIMSAVHAAAEVGARKNILVLSGGASPVSNHYSQYLQTKTLTDNLRLLFGPQSVDVLFGGGNSQSSRTLADVHRSIKTGDITLQDMIFGVITNNAPATKANVEQWFVHGPAKPHSAEDTFFLLVSDHGMPNEDRSFANNCIDLWSYDPATMKNVSWDQECLSKDDLRDLIKRNIPARRTVFAMSQGYSGGFHQMSVSEDHGYPKADINLCGFTAVTEDTTASGSTPDVDGPGYKGYERFLTQQITGKNVVTGKPMAYPRKATLKEAHYAAAAEDTTKDIPLSTSEYYAREWTKVVGKAGFVPRNRGTNMTLVRQAMQPAFDNKLDGAALETATGRLAPVAHEKRNQLKIQEALIGWYDPDLKVLVATGDRASLYTKAQETAQVMAQLQSQLNELGSQALGLQNRFVKPLWIRAVQGGVVPGVGPRELLFEQRILLAAEMAQDSSELACLRYLSRFATSNVQADYLKLQQYCASRGSIMQAFSKRDPAAADASTKANALYAQMNVIYEKLIRLEQRRDQIRRIIIGRSVLAGLVAINAMQDQAAIEEVLGLSDCESSAF